MGYRGKKKPEFLLPLSAASSTATHPRCGSVLARGPDRHRAGVTGSSTGEVPGGSWGALQQLGMSFLPSPTGAIRSPTPLRIRSPLSLPALLPTLRAFSTPSPLQHTVSWCLNAGPGSHSCPRSNVLRAGRPRGASRMVCHLEGRAVPRKGCSFPSHRFPSHRHTGAPPQSIGPPEHQTWEEIRDGFLSCPINSTRRGPGGAAEARCKGCWQSQSHTSISWP